MNRRQKIIISIIGIFLVSFALIGLTYGYFLTRITPNSESESISLETEDLELTYYDGNGSLLPAEMLYPGNKVKFLTKSGEITDVKTFSVENTGLGKIDKYAVVLDEYSVYYTEDAYIDGVTVKANTKTYFQNPEHFKLNITCKVYDSDDLNTPKGDCEEQLEGTLPANNDILLYNSINEDETHVYELSMEFIETNTDQSADMNKTLNARVNIMAVNDTVDLEVTSTDKTAASYIEIEDVVNTTSTSNESKETKASFLNEIDGTNTLNNLSTSSTTRSYIDKDGNYKILGLMPGNYKIKYYNSNTDSLIDTKTVKIVKGKTASIKDNVITITNNSRTFRMSVDSSSGVGTLGNSILSSIPFAEGTLAYEIIYNSQTETGETRTIYSETPLTLPGNASVATERTLSVAADDYTSATGISSYYFRGSVKDNYINYAGMCWRIVRIEGDGSVKLLLAAQKSCSSTNLTSSTSGYISTGGVNYGYDDSNGMYILDYINSSSGARSSLNAMLLRINEENQKLLKNEKWCIGNLTDAYDSNGNKLEQTADELISTGETFYYDARAKQQKLIPVSYICNTTGKEGEVDTYKIGMLTYDEVIFAGSPSSNSYIRENASLSGSRYNVGYWWILTPLYYSSAGTSAFLVSGGGSVSSALVNKANYYESEIYFDIIYYYGVRPSVTLIPGIKATGEGTVDNPYELVV